METNVKNAKISVIVPVYNTPTLHLNRCIDSLLQQDYTNTEIILVDDGSAPDCRTVLDALAACDDRIRLFHKANGGVSSARNYGMTKISGDFLTFIDSDDYLEPHAWSVCMEALEKKLQIWSASAGRIILQMALWSTTALRRIFPCPRLANTWK